MYKKRVYKEIIAMIYSVLNSIQALNKLKDSTYTTDASEYIANNLTYVINATRRMAKRSVIDVEEVVQDVYLSLCETEKQGGGFDTSRGISVEKFVFGRIGGYLKHDRYKGYDTKASNGDMYPINESHSEDISYLYANAPDLKDSMGLVNETVSIQEELRTCLIATKCAGISLKQILLNPNQFGTKAVAWLLKNNLDMEALDSLRCVLEYPNKPQLLSYLEQIDIA